MTDDKILLAIQSARAASLAAYHALTAVESLLDDSEGELVLEANPVQAQPEQQPEPEPRLEGCQHEKAVEVSSREGTWIVCGCGHQQEV